MYKLLATSALVAAGLWGMTEAASAQAKVAPIAVSVGGFLEQTFGFAGNKDAPSNGAANGNVKLNKQSQFSDSEIWFNGRTQLENGIAVGFRVRLEANTAADQIDESWAFMSGAFGEVFIGTRNSADVIGHWGVPAAGLDFGNGLHTGRSYSPSGSSAQGWILRPGAVSAVADPAAPGCHAAGGNANVGGAAAAAGGGVGTSAGAGNGSRGCDQQRITYFTPRMAGFQLGASFTPNMIAEDGNGFNDQRLARTNGVHGNLNYVNSFDGLDVRASAGITKVGGVANGSTVAVAAQELNDYTDYALGLQVGMGNFLVGGSYRVIDARGAAENGYGYAVGAMYVAGPLAVGISHLSSKVDGAAAAGSDELTQNMITGSYQIGPGVFLIGALFNIDWKDETTVAANNNKGTGAIGGIHLRF